MSTSIVLQYLALVGITVLLGMSLQCSALLSVARELMQLHVRRQQHGWEVLTLCM